VFIYCQQKWGKLDVTTGVQKQQQFISCTHHPSTYLKALPKMKDENEVVQEFNG
jgi:hypothetical protein